MSPPELPYRFWREQAKIDYFSLFVPAWLSLNAWMRDRFTGQNERILLEDLKVGGHPLSDGFAGLVQADEARGSDFRSNLGELHRALVSANIAYDKRPTRIVSLACCAIDWHNGHPVFESVLRESKEEIVSIDSSEEYGAEKRQNLKLDSGLWVENDPARLFAAYIEIVYQVRCALFHGALPPNAASERVVRYAYLTLFAVMEMV